MDEPRSAWIDHTDQYCRLHQNVGILAAAALHLYSYLWKAQLVGGVPVWKFGDHAVRWIESRGDQVELQDFVSSWVSSKHMFLHHTMKGF